MEDSTLASNMDWTHIRPWTPLFQYPHDDAGADRIIVTRSDYECLEPDFSLNRTVVDFALRVIVADRRRSPLGSDPAFINIARDVHAFPCDFFTMLSAGNERGKLKADKRQGAARVCACGALDARRRRLREEVPPRASVRSTALEPGHHLPPRRAREARPRAQSNIRRAVADLVDAGITEAAQLAEDEDETPTPT